MTRIRIITRIRTKEKQQTGKAKTVKRRATYMCWRNFCVSSLVTKMWKGSKNDFFFQMKAILTSYFSLPFSLPFFFILFCCFLRKWQKSLFFSKKELDFGIFSTDYCNISIEALPVFQTLMRQVHFNFWKIMWCKM